MKVEWWTYYSKNNVVTWVNCSTEITSLDLIIRIITLCQVIFSIQFTWPDVIKAAVWILCLLALLIHTQQQQNNNNRATADFTLSVWQCGGLRINNTSFLVIYQSEENFASLKRPFWFLTNQLPLQTKTCPLTSHPYWHCCVCSPHWSG